MPRPSFSPQEPFESERQAAQRRAKSPQPRFPKLFTDQESLFPLQRPDAQLFMTGRFSVGGRARICEGENSATIDLGPVVFTILAVLAMSAKQAAGHKPFTVAGFVPAEQLSRELATWCPKGEEDRVIGDIHDLRLKLANEWSRNVPRKVAQRWAKELIERNHCGYRLSIQPANVHLDIPKDKREQATRNKSRTNRLPIQLGPETRFDTDPPKTE